MSKTQLAQVSGQLSEEVGTHTQAESATGPREAREGAKKSVLLVDDSELTLLINKLMFEKLGYEVELANSAQEAVSAVRRSHFDFIVLDFHMPKADGSQCARLIKKQLAFQRQPSVMIASTSDHSEETKARFAEAGTEAFLMKPISIETLAATLNAFSNRAPSSARI